MQVVMEVQLERLRPAKWNPRRNPSERKMQELVDSVTSHGVLQPIVVRKVALNGNETPGVIDYEIVCGSRRVKASGLAGLDSIPAIERNVDDQTAAEIAMAENIQDEDMSPLDEALGYDHLMKNASMNEVAERLGVTVSHIRRRIRLLDLCDKARDMLERDEITLSHADQLVRISPGDQEAALDVCTTSTVFDDITEPAPVGLLAQWIGKNVTLDPQPEIVADYFPEMVDDTEGDVDDIPKLLKLSESMQPGSDLGIKNHGLIGRKSWMEIGARDTYSQFGGETIPDCQNGVEGVVVHGGPMRVVPRVCAKKGCEVHRPGKGKKSEESAAEGGGKTATKPKVEDWKIEEAKREEDARQWEDELPVVFKAFVEHMRKAHLQLTPEFIREVLQLGDTEKFFARAFGDDWEFKSEDIPIVLAAASVGWWQRDRCRNETKKYKFKFPRRSKAALNAIKEAGERVAKGKK